MIKEKKLSKTLVSIFLILATCFSIVFVANQVSKTSKDTNLSLSAVSDISDSSITPLSLTETYGIINGIGNGGSGTKVDPYYDVDWYGRVKSGDYFTTLSGARACRIEINVDPRNIGAIQDIIIEYKSYEQAPPLGTKKALNLNSFGANIKFYSSKKDVIEKSITPCYGRSSYGQTLISGASDLYKVEVEVTFNFQGTDYTYYYRFG